MKKVLSAILALAMMFSLASITFADGNDTNEAAKKMEADSSVTGSVTPEISKASIVLEDGTTIELDKEMIAGYIRITSHVEAEEVMQKVREQNLGKTDEELLNIVCENSWTFGQNMTLLDMYDVADNAQTSVGFMKAHGEGIVEKAVEFLKLTDAENAEEEINKYVIAIIFDIKVDLNGLANAAGVSADSIKKLMVEMSTEYADENCEIFFQRDCVPLEKYRELVKEDKTVDINADDVVFFDGRAFNKEDDSFVITGIDPKVSGPFIMYVKQLEEAK